MVSTLSNVFVRQDLLKSLVISELRSSTARTRLGWLWWLLDPLLQMGVYWVVMVVIFGRGRLDYQPYWIFLFWGLIAWKHVSESTAKATNVLRARENLIKSVPFPTIVLPLSVVISGFVFFGISVAVLIALTLVAAYAGLLVQHSGDLLPFLQLPLLMLFQLVIVTGIALPLSCLGVLITDLSPFISHLLRIAYFFSPGLYGIDLVHQALLERFGPTAGDLWFDLYLLNPFAILISGYRDSLFYGRFMPAVFWWYLVLEAAVLLYFGYRLYLYYDRRVIKFL